MGARGTRPAPGRSAWACGRRGEALRRSGADLLAAVLEQLPRGRLLPEEPWRRRHRGIVLFLAAHVAALAALALLAGFPPLHAVADVAPVAACAALASWHRLSRRLGSVVASLGLVASSALLVHLWGGAGEAHFHFFLVIGLLTLYQDWLPFLVALAAIVAHHLIVGVLHPAGVFDNPAALEHPVRWALIHGAFVLATTVANLVTDAAMYEVKRQGRCGVAVHGRGVVRSARPRPVAAAA